MEHETGLLDDIAVTESRIQMQHELINTIQERDPVLCQRMAKSLTINESTLASLKKDLGLVQSNLHIGSVYNAKLGHTDYTTTSRWTQKLAMDLALVKLKPDRLGHEEPHKIYWKENADTPRIPKNTTCNFWEVDSLGARQKANEHINVVSRLSRLGSYTMGIVSEFKAETLEFKEDGREGKMRGVAWVITCPRRHLNPNEQDAWPFAAAGDSGSFIIAAAGWKYDGKDNKITMLSQKEAAVTNDPSKHPFIVGLLFGVSCASNIALFIPFDAVKSEIESMTGEKLVWPQKRSEALREAKASLPSWMKDRQDNSCV